MPWKMTLLIVTAILSMHAYAKKRDTQPSWVGDYHCKRSKDSFSSLHLVFYHYRSDRNAKPPIKMLRSRRGFIAKRCVILQFCWSRSRQWTVRLSKIHLTLKLLQEAHKSWRNWTRTKEKSKRKRICWASTQTKRVSECESKSKTACSWRSSSSGRANIEELKSRGEIVWTYEQIE